jgi:hypothetical protein
MTRIETLLSQPGVGQRAVRQIIATAAGTSTSVKVADGQVIKATVLKQSGSKPAK